MANDGIQAEQSQLEARDINKYGMILTLDLIDEVKMGYDFMSLFLGHTIYMLLLLILFLVLCIIIC